MYSSTGMQWDLETAVCYYRHRYYHSQLGRFGSRDPISNLGGPNLYQYVGDRPTSATDPLGLVTWEQVDGDDAVYSCHCGWIDWTHAGEDEDDIVNSPAAKLWTGILAEAGTPSRLGGGYYATFSQSQKKWGYTMPYVGKFYVKSGLTPGQKASVAMAIFQDVSIGFEQMQYVNYPLDLVMWRPHSAFAEEDLPSNLILFYKVLMHYENSDIRRWCVALGKDASLAVARESEALHAHEEPNYSFAPRYHTECPTVQRCCPQGGTWPSQLTGLTPAAEGSLWRDWRSETLFVTSPGPILPQPRPDADEVIYDFGHYEDFGGWPP